MEGVSRTLLASTKRRKLSQDICDFAVFIGAVRWRDEFDRSQARCDYDEPATTLRNTIIGTIDHPFLGVVSEMETFVGENGQEIVEDLVTLEFGDIFHTHDIGLQLSDEAAEVPEQGPFRVTVVLDSLGIFRKRLAGCAPDENARMTFRVVTDQVACRECSYAFVVKSCSRIIVFIGKSAHAIDVVTSSNFHACVQEAASQTACSAKEVDRCRAYFPRFWHFSIISILR